MLHFCDALYKQHAHVMSFYNNITPGIPYYNLMYTLHVQVPTYSLCVYSGQPLVHECTLVRACVDGTCCFSSGRVSPKETAGSAILTLKYPRT